MDFFESSGFRLATTEEAVRDISDRIFHLGDSLNWGPWETTAVPEGMRASLLWNTKGNRIRTCHTLQMPPGVMLAQKSSMEFKKTDETVLLQDLWKDGVIAKLSKLSSLPMQRWDPPGLPKGSFLLSTEFGWSISLGRRNALQMVQQVFEFTKSAGTNHYALWGVEHPEVPLRPGLKRVVQVVELFTFRRQGKSLTAECLVLLGNIPFFLGRMPGYAATLAQTWTATWLKLQSQTIRDCPQLHGEAIDGSVPQAYICAVSRVVESRLWHRHAMDSKLHADITVRAAFAGRQIEAVVWQRRTSLSEITRDCSFFVPGVEARALARTVSHPSFKCQFVWWEAALGLSNWKFTVLKPNICPAVHNAFEYVRSVDWAPVGGRAEIHSFAACVDLGGGKHLVMDWPAGRCSGADSGSTVSQLEEEMYFHFADKNGGTMVMASTVLHFSGKHRWQSGIAAKAAANFNRLAVEASANQHAIQSWVEALKSQECEALLHQNSAWGSLVHGFLTRLGHIIPCLE